MHSASRGGNRRRGSAARDRGCYLPREVFFGRLSFACAFFTVWASDFERFLPATSDSFPIDVLQDAPYRGSGRPVAMGRLPPGQGLRRGRPRRPAGDRWAQARSTSADRAAGAERVGVQVCAVDVAEWRKCDTRVGGPLVLRWPTFSGRLRDEALSGANFQK